MIFLSVPLFGILEIIIDIYAAQLEEAAQAFRRNRVFCLVFILCV